MLIKTSETDAEYLESLRWFKKAGLKLPKSYPEGVRPWSLVTVDRTTDFAFNFDWSLISHWEFAKGLL